MARYDSPGYPTPLPGNPDFQSHDSGMTAEGGAGWRPPMSAPLEDAVTVPIVPSGATLAAADDVSVGRFDVLVPSQVQAYQKEPFTGADGMGETGAGDGTVWPPASVHANEMNTGEGAWAPQRQFP